MYILTYEELINNINQKHEKSPFIHIFFTYSTELHSKILVLFIQILHIAYYIYLQEIYVLICYCYGK